MGQETKIEWCDSTVNPTGFQCCGCELWNKENRDCYAGRFAERIGSKGSFDEPVELMPGRMSEAAGWPDLRGTNRMDKPWLNGRPRVIFIGDMADTLQPGVPFDYLKREIIDVVNSQEGKRHVWMWLTKQAKRLVAFNLYLDQEGLDWPENLWAGVTVTSERMTWRLDELVKTDAKVRFVSYEPAWGPVDFSRWTLKRRGEESVEPSGAISLIIVGGQSGNKRQPFNVIWAQNTIETCEADEVCCFVKQLGSATFYESLGVRCELKLKHAKGGDWSEWPKGLRVREFPEV